MEKTNFKELAIKIKNDFILNLSEGACDLPIILNYIQDCCDKAAAGDGIWEAKLFALSYVSSPRHRYLLSERGLSTPSDRAVEEACLLYEHGYSDTNIHLTIYLCDEWDEESQRNIEFEPIDLYIKEQKCVCINAPAWNIGIVNYDGINIPKTFEER